MPDVSEEIAQAISKLQALRDHVPAAEWPRIARIQRLIEALGGAGGSAIAQNAAPNKSGDIIAYRLQPVRQLPEGGIATAALMTCMATGEVLSGMGGGGDFLSPKVVEALRGGDCTIIKGALPPGLEA